MNDDPTTSTKKMTVFYDSEAGELANEGWRIGEEATRLQNISNALLREARRLEAEYRRSDEFHRDRKPGFPPGVNPGCKPGCKTCEATRPRRPYWEEQE